MPLSTLDAILYGSSWTMEKDAHGNEHPTATIEYTCPLCRRRTSLRAWRNRPAFNHIWNLKSGFETGVKNVTIEPSIQDHPQGRNWPKCTAHISVTNSIVTLH